MLSSVQLADGKFVYQPLIIIDSSVLILLISNWPWLHVLVTHLVDVLSVLCVEFLYLSSS